MDKHQEIIRCKVCGNEWEATEEVASHFCPHCNKIKAKLKPLDDPRLKELVSLLRGSSQKIKDKK